MQDVPEAIKPKAMSAVEIARKEYHDATVEMATIDGKLIDVSATLEELKIAHGESIIRVNRAREALVDARSPRTLTGLAAGDEDRLRAIDGGAV